MLHRLRQIEAAVSQREGKEVHLAAPQLAVMAQALKGIDGKSVGEEGPQARGSTPAVPAAQEGCQLLETIRTASSWQRLKETTAAGYDGILVLTVAQAQLLFNHFAAPGRELSPPLCLRQVQPGLPAAPRRCPHLHLLRATLPCVG